MNVFDEANSILDNFIQNNLSSYHQFRNYDYGIRNRTNVSQISKYTSHRILYEYEIIKKLKLIDKKRKFTDEILWRLYWRGYLENYKSIWIEYKNFKCTSYNPDTLKKATLGKTGIECFDTWILELRENNYLHNHTRMWLASIWIFALRLPWQIGARYFMTHLVDGDAASNTLSWRWIAGIHTNNKPYIATINNINKYTVNRFIDVPINISINMYLIKNNHHKCNKIPTKKDSKNRNILLMFDNDLYISNRSKLFNSYSKVYIIFNRIIENRFNLSDSVAKFKERLIKTVNQSIPNSIIINSSDLNKLLNDFKYIDVIYPGIGSNLDLINSYSIKKEIDINYIYREDDLSTWMYASSGFYKFKSLFYKNN